MALRLLRFYFCIVVMLYPLAFTITPCLRAAGDSAVLPDRRDDRHVAGTHPVQPPVCFLQVGHYGRVGGHLADWFIRIAFYLPRYLSGRWLKKKVI